MSRTLLDMIRAGEATLVYTAQSSSKADAWYRVAQIHEDRRLQCDCGQWTRGRQWTGRSFAERSCKHTDLARRLLKPVGGVTGPVTAERALAAESPLIAAVRQQWPGLLGDWSIEEARTNVGTDVYLVYLLRLTAIAGVFTGTLALAQRHAPTRDDLVAGLAGWAGFQIAAGVARASGYPLVGAPPQHWRAPARATPARARTTRPATGAPPPRTAFGLNDILSVGNRRELGDGRTPDQRAEALIEGFLGPEYERLQRQGYLDVSSRLCEGRVYRVRLDRNRAHDLRVRVFESGRYKHDLCIVRETTSVPVQDQFLTIFLGLMTDEIKALSVVRGVDRSGAISSYGSNVFPPFSDTYYEGGRREAGPPPRWQAPRAASVA